LAVMASGAAALGVGAVERALPRQLSDAERAEIVQAHNARRSRVGVRPVRWSGELEADAERWASNLARRGCRLSHDSRSDDGENLFWTSAVEAGRERRLNPVTPTAVVEYWGAEAQFYSYERNRCARGKKCGHYLQMVWDSTREIGCAAATCSDLGQVWVCRYRPGRVGNRRPYS